MVSSNGKFAIAVIVDIILFLLVTIAVFLLEFLGKPYRRGFFCDDDTIRYPYKPSTISTMILLVIYLLLPIIIMALIEYLHIRDCYFILTGKKKFLKWFWSYYRFLKVFLFGFAISLLTVEIFKFSLGTLRPYFLDVCNPDWPQVNCSDGNNYVTHDVCGPEQNDGMIREARLSFISGHASIAAFGAFFLIFYMQYRLIIRRYTLVRPFLQYICFGSAILVAVSRVSDHHHHWSDVLVGFINGFIFAALCTLVCLKLRKRKLVNVKVCKKNKGVKVRACTPQRKVKGMTASLSNRSTKGSPRVP